MKFLIILLLLIPLTVSAATGTFTAPTEREDGTSLSLSEIAGYRVYVDGIEDLSISPLTSDATAFSLVLGSGTFLVELTTLDTDGLESKRTGASFTGNFPPAAPLNFTISK